MDREAIRRFYADRARQVGVRKTAAETGLSRAAVTSIIADVARDGTFALGERGIEALQALGASPAVASQS